MNGHGLLAIWIGFIPAPLVTAAAVKESTISFERGKELISVEHFREAGNGKHPGVILLHGADGFQLLGGVHYKMMAKELAAKGFSVYLVH